PRTAPRLYVLATRPTNFTVARLLRKYPVTPILCAICSRVRSLPAFQVEIKPLWQSDGCDYYCAVSHTPALGGRDRPRAVDRTVCDLLGRLVHQIAHDGPALAAVDRAQPRARRPGDLGRDLPRAQHLLRPGARRARGLPLVGAVAPRVRSHRPE